MSTNDQLVANAQAGADKGQAYVRFNVVGKSRAMTSGPRQYLQQAERDMRIAARSDVTIPLERYREELEKLGVPAAAADEYVAGLQVSDDTWVDWIE